MFCLKKNKSPNSKTDDDRVLKAQGTTQSAKNPAFCDKSMEPEETTKPGEETDEILNEKYKAAVKKATQIRLQHGEHIYKYKQSLKINLEHRPSAIIFMTQREQKTAELLEFGKFDTEHSEKMFAQDVRHLAFDLKMIANAYVFFPSIVHLNTIHVEIRPTEGLFDGDTFEFVISFPHKYNEKPPVIKSTTIVTHPKIYGNRTVSYEVATGNKWKQPAALSEIIKGLSKMFSNEGMIVEDAVNVKADALIRESKTKFQAAVKREIREKDSQCFF